MKWIRIVEQPSEGRKTRIFYVHSKDGGFLGEIKWYGAWRKYSFFPSPRVVFEEDCLRDIAQFMEEASKKHKEKW